MQTADKHPIYSSYLSKKARHFLFAADRLFRLMDKGKAKGNKTGPSNNQQNRNQNGKGQGTTTTGNQQQKVQKGPAQQKNVQPKPSTPNTLEPPGPGAEQPQVARPPLQRRHTSKTKTPLRQPQLGAEAKTPPPEPRKSAEVRVGTENILDEQQPGMALLTPHGRYRHHSRVVAYIDIVCKLS